MGGLGLEWIFGAAGTTVESGRRYVRQIDDAYRRAGALCRAATAISRMMTLMIAGKQVYPDTILTLEIGEKWMGAVWVCIINYRWIDLIVLRAVAIARGHRTCNVTPTFLFDGSTTR